MVKTLNNDLFSVFDICISIMLYYSQLDLEVDKIELSVKLK